MLEQSMDGGLENGSLENTRWRRAGTCSIMRFGMLALLLVAGLALSSERALAEAVSLKQVQADVTADYPAVTQLSTAGLTNLLAPRGSGKHSPVALFDVRELDEFEVSHLKGARRVDPDMWASTFMTTFGASLKGKVVVFYCSVGVRSSQMAQAVQDRLKEAGAVRVYNLEGGIFAWHNEQRPLVMGSEGSVVPTDLVHPYDNTWGRLVNRQDRVSYKPAGS